MFFPAPEQGSQPVGLDVKKKTERIHSVLDHLDFKPISTYI
jgi:hypothetical protein